MDIKNDLKGFLFISNPRLTSRHPNGRLDEDLRIAVLAKLKQAFDLANQQGWTVVFLGQLFDRNRDMDPKLLSGLFSLLSSAQNKPYYLINTHELNGKDIVAETTLSVIASTGLLNIITEHGTIGIFDMNGVKVGLGASPFGYPEQKDVTWSGLVQKGIWIVNDIVVGDMAVSGIDVVINGYTLTGKDTIQTNDTQFVYPASISRLSLEEKEIKPVVYSWTPGNAIQAHALDFMSHIFSESEAEDETEWTEALTESQFVEALKSEFTDEDNAGEFLFKDDLESVMNELAAPDEVRLMMQDLIGRTIRELESAS